MGSDMELDDFEKDALKELGNIGCSHAASVLSDMFGKNVSITVPDLDIIPITSFPDLVGGAEDIVAGIFTLLSGDIDATMMLVFKEAYAYSMADVLLGNPSGTTSAMGEMEMSAIKEMGNIMTSAFSNAMADFMDFKIVHTPPAFGMDMAGAILDAVIVQLGQKADEAVFFNTNFVVESESIIGHLFLSPEPESIDKLLVGLKAKLGM